MHSLRIRGVVKLADAVRRELSRPISDAQKEELRRLVSGSILKIDSILSEQNATIEALPHPTRRAYEYLSGADFDSIATVASGDADNRVCRGVSFVGLPTHWERILDTMARPVPPGQVDTLHAAVRVTSRRIEARIRAMGLRSRDLAPRARDIRGWLALFAERENLDAYLAAVSRAKSVFEASLDAHGRFQAPALIMFRPARALCRLRGDENGTRVTLPTPMVILSAKLFGFLAAAALNGRGKQQVLEAKLGDEYQALQAEIESLGGLDDQPAGAHHHLDAAFERVQKEYFGGVLARPCLTWSPLLAGRPFAHYTAARDTVMISRSLDRSGVPEHALDFVMYRELLYRQCGVSWRKRRETASTPEFQANERGFRRFAEAEAYLRNLARDGGTQGCASPGLP